MNRLKKAGTWALPVLLTVIAVVWAVVAIGGILTATAHPVLAYGTAVLYDAVWLYALAQETAHRRQGTSARLPKVIGWLFLPLTVAVLAVHGVLAADLLAAVVGALVPVLAKMTLIMAIDRDATRITARAQAAIDRTRATTRDKIAVSRAIARARTDETKAAADIVKQSGRRKRKPPLPFTRRWKHTPRSSTSTPCRTGTPACPPSSPTTSLTPSSPGVCRTTKPQAARGVSPSPRPP